MTYNVRITISKQKEFKALMNEIKEKGYSLKAIRTIFDERNKIKKWVIFYNYQEMSKL